MICAIFGFIITFFCAYGIITDSSKLIPCSIIALISYIVVCICGRKHLIWWGISYILASFLLLALVKGKADDSLLGTAVLFVYFACGIMCCFFFFYGKTLKCPSCKKDWAGKEINRIILEQGNPFPQTDNNGKTHFYANQLVEYHYRCKYCGEEWTKTKEEKKQLDS